MAERRRTVHAIVVSYRDSEAVAPCVRSRLASTYHELRVIVVDNASGDGTVAGLRERFPGCRVVCSVLFRHVLFPTDFSDTATAPSSSSSTSLARSPR